jgi:hypothetical protein
MKRLRLKTSLTLLLIGFVIGFCTSFLFNGCVKSSQSKTTTVTSSKDLRKEANSLEVSYQKQIETLTDQNIELQQQLEVSQGLLQQAKEETRQKEKKIQKMIEPIISSESLFSKTWAPYKAKSFSLGDDLPVAKIKPLDKQCPCDSLVEEVAGYIQSGHRKDSLYELQLLQLDSIVTGKNLVIETSLKAYTDLHVLFDKSLADQTALGKENKLLKSASRRQRFKGKVLTGALLILSGFTTNYVLRH